MHVDDIAGAIIASFGSEATGAFNIADDLPCSQNRVIEAAADMLGVPHPPMIATRRSVAQPDGAGFLCREPPGGERAGQAAAGVAAEVRGFQERVGGLCRCIDTKNNVDLIRPS